MKVNEHGETSFSLTQFCDGSHSFISSSFFSLPPSSLCPTLGTKFKAQSAPGCTLNGQSVVPVPVLIIWQSLKDLQWYFCWENVIPVFLFLNQFEHEIKSPHNDGPGHITYVEMVVIFYSNHFSKMNISLVDLFLNTGCNFEVFFYYSCVILKREFLLFFFYVFI